MNPRLFSFSKAIGATLIFVGVSLTVPCSAKSPEDTLLLTLESREVRPFATNAEVFVFLFLSTTCPISNSYAPEIRRLEADFTNRKVAFVLIYPDPSDTPVAIEKHVREFNLPFPVLRDPQHHFAKATGATVTPEAVVFSNKNTLTYRGRIDDRHVSFGVKRPQATQHDLQDAISATLNGDVLPNPRTCPIGCYIGDLK